MLYSVWYNLYIKFIDDKINEILKMEILNIKIDVL